MPSVAMPSMDKTMSPTAIPPLAAFPPSVSCSETTNSLNYRCSQPHHSQDYNPAGGRVKVMCVDSLTGFMDPFHYGGIFGQS